MVIIYDPGDQAEKLQEEGLPSSCKESAVLNIVSGFIMAES